MLSYMGDGAARPNTPLAPSHLLRLYVYVRERDGCYYLASPRLSWMEDPPAGEISNIDQHDLAANAEQLGHVIAVNPLTREERFWPTWKAFADQTGLTKL